MLTGLFLLLAGNGYAKTPVVVERVNADPIVSFDGALTKPEAAQSAPGSGGPPVLLRVPARWVSRERQEDLDKIIPVLSQILHNTKLDSLMAAKGVDARALILAQIRIESELDRVAVSRAGAVGYMQLMPGTFKLMFNKYRDQFDPGMQVNDATMRQLWPNLTAGILYMRYLMEMFQNDPNCMDKVIKSYNAGPTKVLKNKKLKSETIQYGPKIKRYYHELLEYNSLADEVVPDSDFLSSAPISVPVSPKPALVAPKPTPVPPQHEPVSTKSDPISPKPKTERAVASDPADRKPSGSLKWVKIEGGRFSMGSETAPKNEMPIHDVEIKTFHMTETEVTVEQYAECVVKQACTSPNDGGEHCNWNKPDRLNHPVNCLDWDQARIFAEFAGGRLPTEAEWEFAATSRGRNPYPWGAEEASCAKAVMFGCGPNQAQPVCSKIAGNTEQGLCDMSGNVWEWVQDAYQDSYLGASPDGHACETAGSYRVMRGGAFIRHDAGFLRSRARGVGAAKDRHGYVGFRLAR